MNREQEDLKFLGFLGIFKESFKLILTSRKIFTKITLALILPFSCIILANFGISTFITNKILHNTSTLNNTQVGTQAYNKVSSSILYESISYWLVNIVYLGLCIVFLLLSVSAVIYTIACIYTGKEIIFKKVIRVVPKVWKRLMITYLSLLCVIFAYTFVVVLVILLIGAVIFSVSDKSKGNWLSGISIIVIIGAIFYLVGIIYMTFIWQLVYAISVLENNCGFQAMGKSKALIKGKIGSSLAIFLVLGICSVPNYFLIKKLGLSDGGVGVWERILYGVLTVVWLTFISLLNLVIQTVLYFVCKSYHHENINKSSLSDHLEGYNGEYVPLNPKVVQLEGLNV